MGLKVIVTGASTGIGRGAVLEFSKDGHEVFAVARSDAKLSQTVKLAEEAGGAKVYKGVGDVGIEADVQRNHTEAIKALGENIDVVVLNAGVGLMSPLEHTSADQFDTVFNTNVRGVFLWLKAVLPAFKKRGSGQIVIINSVSGEAALVPNFTAYTASKFAISGLAQALRLELQGSGIKVASVYPGVVDTDIFDAPVAESILANGQTLREIFDVASTSLSVDDVARAIATITYQSPRSDIEKLTVWPMKQPSSIKS